MCELRSDAWANAIYKLIFGSLKICGFFFFLHPSYAFCFLSSSSSTFTHPYNEKVEQLSDPQEGYVLRD